MKLETIGPTEVSTSANAITKKEYYIQTSPFGDLCVNHHKVSVSSPIVFAAEFWCFNINNNGINYTLLP